MSPGKPLKKEPATGAAGGSSGLWLFKTEPDDFSFDDLEAKGHAVWDGVRNNLALSHLRRIRAGDRVIIYHTGGEKSLVGLARVTRGAYPDPKLDDRKLVVVDLKPWKRLPRAVSLAEVKARPDLKGFPLVRMSRLSVMMVSAEEWDTLLAMAGAGS